MKLYCYHKRECQKFLNVGVSAISKHLKNIFEEQELDKNLVTEKCSLTADDGKKYNMTIYSLMISIVLAFIIRVAL